MLDYIVFHYIPFLRRFPPGVREVLLGLPIVMLVCAVYWFIRRAWHKKRLGAALPILWNKADFRRTTLVGFVLTYFIELRVQPFIERNSSIDDLICNTLGTSVGYLLFILLRKIFPKFIESFQRTIKTQKAHT